MNSNKSANYLNKHVHPILLVGVLALSICLVIGIVFATVKSHPARDKPSIGEEQKEHKEGELPKKAHQTERESENGISECQQISGIA
jgi:hypothetical protein